MSVVAISLFFLCALHEGKRNETKRNETKREKSYQVPAGETVEFSFFTLNLQLRTTDRRMYHQSY